MATLKSMDRRRLRTSTLTEQNKAFLRDYYETFHLKGDHSDPGRYFI